ncbi:MAG: DUF4293 domain-containing protein [Alistipes sp.]|nr:DUF4293 domain-containing protein [Alistipes sp.]
MIQRIQTLYLFIAAAMCAVSIFLPLAQFAAGAESFDLCAYGLKDSDGQILIRTNYMAMLLDAACVLPLVIIFLYNRRMLQFRLCVAEIVLLVGAQVIMLIYCFLANRMFSELAFHASSIRVTAFLPVAAILFCWLAARGIMHDEIMVRSLDRIR